MEWNKAFRFTKELHGLYLSFRSTTTRERSSEFFRPRSTGEGKAAARGAPDTGGLLSRWQRGDQSHGHPGLGRRPRNTPRRSRSPPAAPVPASSGGQQDKDACTRQMQVQKDARVEKESRKRLCSLTGSSLRILGLLPRRKGLPESHRSERRPPGTCGAQGSAEGGFQRRAGTGAARLTG